MSRHQPRAAAIPLPMVSPLWFQLERVRLVGQCRCGGWVADAPCRFAPRRPLVCIDCQTRQSADEAVGPVPGLSLREYDRAAWLIQQDAAERTAIGFAPAVDDALTAILARVATRRAGADAVRVELAAAGLEIVSGPALRGNVAAATPELLAKCRTYREELAGLV